LAKLTDDDTQAIAGKKDQFLGKLQERCGMGRAQAEKELDTWLHSQHETEAPRTRSSGGGAGLETRRRRRRLPHQMANLQRRRMAAPTKYSVRSCTIAR